MTMHNSIAELLPTLRLGKMSVEQMHTIYATDQLSDLRKRNLVELMQWHSTAEPEERAALEEQFQNQVREALNELRQD